MANGLPFLTVVKLFRGDAMQEFGTDRNSGVRPNHSISVFRDFRRGEYFRVLKRREFRLGSSDRWSEIDNDAATVTSFYQECRWSAGPNPRQQRRVQEFWLIWLLRRLRTRSFGHDQTRHC